MGRGIRKSSTSLPLYEGITVHDALAAIATFTQAGQVVPIDDIADAANKQIFDQLFQPSAGISQADVKNFANEQAALVEGLIRGFYKHVWPRLMSQYPTIVAIEAEMEYVLADDDEMSLIFMTKPDLVVEDKEGNLVYIEYKTTSSKKENWINSWDTAVQLHSSVKATGATLGREPVAVQIVGLYKGYESYGKQSSPMCYAYKKTGNPPFTQDVVQYEYKAGFKRFATWELEGGVKAWVDSMPDNVLANQFPMTAQIFVNDDLVSKFFGQRVRRETRIALANSLLSEQLGPEDRIAVMSEYYQQKWDQCVPSFGWACEYKKLCHGFVADPLREGFELREPHHQRELDVFNAE